MPSDKTVSRRTFIAATGAFLSLPSLNLLAQQADDSAAVAEEAYIWGLPLVQTNRYRELAKGYPINRFILSTRLSSPEDRVAGPNVDTLYGFAFLDVSKEPLILHVPDTNDRYYSVHLIDAYQNSFAYVGRRATGTREGEYAITAPGWQGRLPAGVAKIESPTSHLFALTRTLVRGQQDLPAAQAIQLQYTLRTLSGVSSAGAPPLTTAAAFNVFPFLDLSSNRARIFQELNSGLAFDPPSSHEKAPFDRFAKVGIGAKKQQPLKLGLDAKTLEEAAARSEQRIHDANYSTDVNGWKVNYHITNFIEDPLLRASVNRIGPGAHIAKEALYFAAKTDHEGKPLNGQSRYRIRFPEGGLPPVDAFWSLILYGADFALVSNPIQRYAITDRTEGLVKSPDGSLDVFVQTQAIESGNGNWLPAPQSPFQLILRTYQPRPELFNGKYKVPIVERL